MCAIQRQPVAVVYFFKENDMEFKDVVRMRRSVRKFTEQPVTEEQLAALLEAAMAAPSAGNAQPWRFIVVDDKDTLAAVPAIHPYAAMAASAPLAVLVCGDLSAEKYPGFWVQDCAAAVQNMLLAAVDAGLGAVWTGIYPEQERVRQFSAMFGLPEHVVPLALVVAGHAAKTPASGGRFDAAKVRRNRW
jgi:nitroreductase